MTNDEYRQLIAVLGERFDGIEAHLTRPDHEFVALSRRLDATFSRATPHESDDQS